MSYAGSVSIILTQRRGDAKSAGKNFLFHFFSAAAALSAPLR
jgi:hypothetical protein